MQRITVFRLIFTLAALLFIAKPFLGFGALSRELRPRQVHTVLAKSFTKRKPEGLEEADANVESIHQLIINPLVTLFATISFLLLTLFPSVFSNCIKLTQRVIADIRLGLLPKEPAYLLAGKLSI